MFLKASCSQQLVDTFESYRNGTNQPHHVIAVEVGTSGAYSTTKEVVKIYQNQFYRPLFGTLRYE
jgi:hypothetical protein